MPGAEADGWEEGEVDPNGELPDEAAEEAPELEEEPLEDGEGWWAAEGGEEMQVEGAEAPEVHAPGDPNDPSAAVQIELDWDAVAWLQEEDGRRLRKLERLAAGEAEILEEKWLKLQPTSQMAPPGGAGTGHSWSELCARMLCALRTGEELEFTASMAEMVEASGEEGLGACVIEVPGSVEKKALAGKDGAKLLDLCDASDVLAVFTWVAEVTPELKQGDAVEAKYGESWFDAEVLALEDGKVKIKWGHDGSEEELESGQVRAKALEEVPEAPELKEGDLKEGDKIEAKYGDSFHDAEAACRSWICSCFSSESGLIVFIQASLSLV